MSATTNPQSQLDVWMLERRLSRGVAGVGLLACIAIALSSPTRQIPVAALMAILGLYALVKVVVLFLGLKRGLKLWPANLAEIAALSTVGYVLWTGSKEPVWMIIIVTLLLGGGAWRRHVAQRLGSGNP